MTTDFSPVTDFVENLMPFAQTLGLQVTEASATQVSLLLPDRKSNHNHVGFSHAGAQYTLAEMTAASMCNAALLDLADRFALLMAKGVIKYLTPAEGDIVSLAEMSPEISADIRQNLLAEGKVKVPQRVVLHDEKKKCIAECDFLVYLRLGQ